MNKKWHSIKNSIPSKYDNRYIIPIIIINTVTDNMQLATFHRMYETYSDFRSYEHIYENPNGYQLEDMLENCWEYYFIVPKDDKKGIY